MCELIPFIHKTVSCIATSDSKGFRVSTNFVLVVKKYDKQIKLLLVNHSFLNAQLAVHQPMDFPHVLDYGHAIEVKPF